MTNSRKFKVAQCTRICLVTTVADEGILVNTCLCHVYTSISRLS